MAAKEEGLTSLSDPAKRAKRSKELLSLEHLDSLSGSLLSSICNVKETMDCQSPIGNSPTTFPLPSLGESTVLSKVKAFLPVLDEANKKLTQAIKEKGVNEFNIEDVGDCEKYVEMDLALGVAELYTPEAIEAAERLVGSEVSNGRVGEESKQDEDTDEDVQVMRTKRPKIEFV